MAVFDLIFSVFTKLWRFLETTKMPLFQSVTLLQFFFLSIVVKIAVDFIVGLVYSPSHGGGGGKTGKGGIHGD